MIRVEWYAHDRWDAYAPGIDRFTVRAADDDRVGALRRAAERIVEVSRREQP